ncbi:hypothetical protein LTR94_038460, partial [Friedmanniomyces endolithicus]
MGRMTTLLGAVVLTTAASHGLAEDQFKLLVLATPGKYHYEYIPIARDNLERLAKLHAFALTYTNKTQ